MLVEHWIAHVGDDRNWPPSGVWDRAGTWAPAYFGTTPPTPANRAPVADAGDDQSVYIHIPTQIILDGSGSYDPDGDSLQYVWVQKAGTSVTLNNHTMVNPSFTISRPANDVTLTFELSVNDGNLSSVLDTVDVVVKPLPGVKGPIGFFFY
jgi:hypothetical protein